MVKGKISRKTGYTSKGERPNVSKKTLKDMKRFRVQNRPLADILASFNHRRRVIAKPQSDKERKLKERYIEEDNVFYVSGSLLQRFSCAGLTKAEAVQAIKTDMVPSLVNKWKPRLSAWVNAQKEYTKHLDSLKYTGSNVTS